MSFIKKFPKNSEKVQLISDLGIKNKFIIEIAFGMKSDSNFAKQWGKQRILSIGKNMSKDPAIIKYGSHLEE